MVIEKCQELIMQSMNGVEIESSKVEFKTKWMNLKSKEGINEFLKDVTAIANTFGLDGYYIIGHDAKKKEIHEVAFEDCGLRDSSDLPFLIIKHCSNNFDFDYYEFMYEDKQIAAIHIPPTLEKPIFIKRYETFDKQGDLKTSTEQRVFVRKGSATFPAGKNDFELMFYDRKNIEPEYDHNLNVISARIQKKKLIPYSEVKNEFYYHYCEVNFVFENTGKRSVSIIDYKVIGYKDDKEIIFEFFKFSSNADARLTGKFISDIFKPGETIPKKIILESNDIGYLINNTYFDKLKLFMTKADRKVISVEFFLR